MTNRTTNWFAKRRRTLGLTQLRLSQLCLVTTASVGNWEAEIAAPEPSSAARLAAAYEVSLDEIAVQIVKLAVRVGERRQRAA